MTAEETRLQILAAATAVFAQKGFAEARMNDIMQAAGLSKGGIYWHFESKDEIIAAIFQRYFEVQLQSLEQILAEDGTAREKLTRLVGSASHDMTEFAGQFPSSLEFYAMASKNEPLRQQVEAFFLSYRRHIELLAGDAIASGEWVKLPVTEVANTILAAFEGVWLIWNVFPEQLDISTQMDSAVTLLLRGLEAKSL